MRSLVALIVGLALSATALAQSSPKLSQETKALSTANGAAATPQRAGVLSQIASGGGWKSSIYLINLTNAPQTVTVNFYADSGGALTLPLSVGGGAAAQASSMTGQTIPANSTLLIESTSNSTVDVHGWADVLSSGAVTGYGVFHYTAANGAQAEGTVPLESSFANTFVLPYDNENQFAAALALVNLSSSQSASVTATAYDDHGNALATQSISIPQSGHTSALLANLIPNTASFRGFVEFTNSGGNITGLGLRVSPQGGITSAPKLGRSSAAVTAQQQRVGVLSQVASGGGWKSSIYLINLTGTAQTVTVNFYSDGGASLTLPVSVAAGPSSQTASVLNQTIPANSTLMLEAASAASVDSHGWAEVLSTGAITGYGVFHYTAASGAQAEGTVPLESDFAGTFVLPYENDNQFASALALVNLDPNLAITASETAYNETGNQLAIQTSPIPQNGHTSALLTGLVASTANTRGFVEFTNSTGNITGLGLRVSPQGGITSTPKLARPAGYTPPALTPVIASLSPASATAGGSSFTLTVNGSHFVSGAAVQWNATPLTTTFIDAATLTAAVPAASITAAGSAAVTVVNPGNVVSNSVTFTVSPAVTPQCASLGGAWNATESGSMSEAATLGGQSDSGTDPVGGSGSVTIVQTGCAIRYDPLAQSGLIGANLTPAQIASIQRSGTVSGNSVTVSGPLALLDTLAAAASNVTVTANLLTATGQVAGNVLTLQETGSFSASGMIPDESGTIVPFTLTITTTSTATFNWASGTRPNSLARRTSQSLGSAVLATPGLAGSSTSRQEGIRRRVQAVLIKALVL